ncbi:DUF1801 domain-containing protein [Aquipuribacter sp. MA13-6]|uniref:DUF1801 domain-containing protein n=1 Tax=unclassified Aquipuribacter TaxID=2635084 RepID=UPI003EEFDAE5
MTAADVGKYLNNLEHPHKDGVRTLRDAILAADVGISEHIKWNAPSFCFGGVDRATMRLAPRDAFQLVLHRGSRVRSDTAGFHFDDGTGLIRWASPYRGVIDLARPDVLEQHLTDVIDLVRRWVVS